ncbi:VanZ family protein [Metabacillus sp. HB246100]
MVIIVCMIFTYFLKRIKRSLLVMKKFLLTLAPLLYMGVIWTLSSFPADAIVETPFSFDDLLKESLHLIEFAILYWLIAFALKAHNKWSERASIFAAIIAILYGLTDEIHQSFVPERSATIIDFVKDTTGVLISYYVAKRIWFKRENH